jgi:hypothetical protein
VIKAKKLSTEDVAALSAITLGRDNIRLINEPWDEARYLALVRACDAYVSLHRAEGFGRSMAEAMYFAKPVIATAYSGNLDFMSDATAYLVPAQPTRLAADDGGYAAGSVWGEPDLEAAARLMAQVERDRAAAAAVGARAQARVRTHLSAEASGARIRERLTDLARRPWAEATMPPSRAKRPACDPSVLVLTPIKNGRTHLARYLQLLQRLDHDPKRLSLAFLESDSDDGTFEALRDAACGLQSRFASGPALGAGAAARPPLDPGPLAQSPAAGGAGRPRLGALAGRRPHRLSRQPAGPPDRRRARHRRPALCAPGRDHLRPQHLPLRRPLRRR